MTFGITSCLGLVFFVGALAAPTDKIVGGQNANISEFPYLVSVRLKGKHFCGGSIISKKHILTAGHCVQGIVSAPYTNVAVFTGSTLSSGSSGKSHRIKSVVVHEDYSDSGSYPDDIAVLTLTEEIKFDANQKKIDLPTKDVTRGETAMVSGWGIRSYPSSLVSPTLQKAQMKIIPSAECLRFMRPLTLYHEQVCAVQKRGIGICSGDSGGPLAANNQVIGIASWVIPCAQGYPDVYTKVYAYKDWIKAIIDKE